jgi:hypothetical protein
MFDTKVAQGKRTTLRRSHGLGFGRMDGEGDVVTGWKNKLQAAAAAVTPPACSPSGTAKMAEPGNGGQKLALPSRNVLSTISVSAIQPVLIGR